MAWQTWINKLFRDGNPSAYRGADGATGRQSPKTGPQGADDDLRRLAGAWHDGPVRLLAGSLGMVGLTAQRARLGDDWAQIAGRAAEIAEEEIRKYLCPADVFRQYDDCTFLICFESHDEDVAQATADRISRSIERRLRTEVRELSSSAAVHTMTAEVDGGTIANSATPFEALHAALRNIVENPSESITKFRTVEALITTRLLFRPMWARNRNGTPINACVLDDWYDGTGAMLSDAEIDDPALRQARMNYNFVMLTKALEAIHLGFKAKKAFRLIVPVHYDTLRDAESRDEYLKLAGEMSSYYLNRLVLEVYGLPEFANLQQLGRVADYGRRLTENVLLRLPPSDPRAAWSLGDKIWGMTQDLSKLDTRSPNVRADLAQNITIAKSAGWTAIAFGANTLGQAHFASSLGFDHVCGGGVHPVAPAPMGSVRIGPSVHPDLGLKGVVQDVKVNAYRDL